MNQSLLQSTLDKLRGPAPAMHAPPGAVGTQQQAPKRECETVMKLLRADSETVRKVGLGKLRKICGEEDIDGSTASEFAEAVHEAKDDQDILEALAELLVVASERHHQRKRAKPSV